MVKIRYIGGRSWKKVSFNRGQPLFFTEENNRTVDIKDQKVIDHIFGSDERGQFQFVLEESEEDQNKSTEEKGISKRKLSKSKKGG